MLNEKAYYLLIYLHHLDLSCISFVSSRTHSRISSSFVSLMNRFPFSRASFMALVYLTLFFQYVERSQRMMESLEQNVVDQVS